MNSPAYEARENLRGLISVLFTLRLLSTAGWNMAYEASLNSHRFNGHDYISE